MATDKDPWRGNVFGAEPLIQRLLVAAGSSQAIAIGEICRLDVATDNVTPMAAITENLHAIVVAKQAQVNGDAARFIEFYIPKLGDIFEFDLDAATAIKFGDELQWTTSQSLKASATDAIAWAVNVNVPDVGVTWPTRSSVFCMFKQATAGGPNLPFVGATQGDGS